MSKRGPANLLEDIQLVRSWLWGFREGTTLAVGTLPEDPILDGDIRGAIYLDKGGAGVEDVLLWAKKDAADDIVIEQLGAGGVGGGITEAEADALYVNTTGDTMTGPLSIDTATAWAPLNLDGATEGGTLNFNKAGVYQAAMYTYADGTLAIGNATDDVVTFAQGTGITTFAFDVNVPDEAYNATNWDGNLEVPTKNAIRDKIETMGGGVTLEQVYDALGGGVLVAGNNIDITHDDLADTITIDVEPLTPADIGTTASVAELDFVDGVTSAIQTQIDGKQPIDTDLTTIAALTATTDNMIQSVASAWASRTPAQVKTALALNNVDNTSDASKPVSSATQTALDLKANLASPTFTGTVTLPVGLTGVIRADTGVVSVDTDVTDIVTAATTGAAGKVELATDAETNTGTDTTRAITPANLEAWTGSAQVTTVGTLASPTLTTPTIASFTNATHGHTDAASGGALTLTQSVAVVFGDGTNVIAINDKRFFSIPVAHTLIRWRILSSVSGTIEFDIWRDTFANYPHTVTESVATSHPLLSGAFMAEDSTITDWTEAGNAGDVYVVNVHAAPTSCVSVTLELFYTRGIA
jgi:hypothetical protein